MASPEVLRDVVIIEKTFEEIISQSFDPTDPA